MPTAGLSFTTTADGTQWAEPEKITNGFTDYGLQMAVYRGECYGIMTQTVQYPGQLFATKFKVGSGWKAWRSLPSKFLSQGRVSVTVLEDRFFIVRRGTNNAVYLLWTEDFDTFHDVGRIGSQYAQTMASPAIAAHNGKLYMAGVGDDHSIYFTVADSDGKREASWKKINGTGTQSALALAVYSGKLYLLHCGYKGDKFYYQTLNDDGTWSSLSSYTTNITSGLSAVSWKYDQLVVSYRGRDKDIKYQFFDGKSWTSKKYIPDVYMKYQTGIATYGGRLVVSFAEASPSGSNSTKQPYHRPMIGMSEKTDAFGQVYEIDGDEWDCKWNEDTPKPHKTWIRRMFCL